MSSFFCEHCGASIQDTPQGYVTGCKHYPLKGEPRPMSERDKEPRIGETLYNLANKTWPKPASPEPVERTAKTKFGIEQATILFEGDELFYIKGQPHKCWHCGDDTNWASINFEGAGFCSQECCRAKWDEYFKACAETEGGAGDE